jgi:hypothetical protein
VLQKEENKMRKIPKRNNSNVGPLQSYPMFAHCEMCGATNYKRQGSIAAGAAGLAGLEPAFNPSGEPMTLCRDCRIGSAELLADAREALLEACRVLCDETRDRITEARTLGRAAITKAES